MKFIIPFLILATSSLLIFTGCCPKPEVRTEYVQLKPIIPAIPLRPVFNPYTIEKIEFNGKELYVMDPVNAAILGVNWENSKSYSKRLEAVIESISEVNASEPLNP